MNYSDKNEMMRNVGMAGNAIAGALGQINVARPPSLEARLEYLRRGVERLSNIRRRLIGIADRIEIRPEASQSGAATPSPSDLCGKFGEVIGFAHANLDEMEMIVTRIEHGLFEQDSAQAQCGIEPRKF